MQRLDVAVYPHLRDQSLVVSRGRLIELPLSADRVTELLAGDGQPGPERSETEGAADVVAAKRLVLELLRLTPRFAAAPPATSFATLIVADAAMMDAVGDIISSALEPAMRVVEVVETSQWATLAVPEPIDVLVTLSGTFDYCPMAGWEDWATEHGCRWAPFYLTDAGAGFGPFVQSGHTPGVRDLAGRWVSAAKKESQARSMLSPPALILGRPVARSFLVWAVATFLADLCSWLEGRAALGSWHNVRLHADRLDIQRDPVLPLPGLWLGSAAGSPDVTGSPLSPDDVLNPKTGIVVGTRSITFTSAIPDGISYVESQTADLGRLQPWASNIYNAGSSWESPAEAQQGALGEAIERYCGNLVDHSALVQASYAGLNRKGERAVDPRTLVLFSDKQYAAAGFPFVPFDLDLRVSWTVAQSLATDERVWVPASLVFVNWNTGQSMYDPPTNPAYYPGIAAGTSRDHAICNALEEVVERDAAMIWWLSGARIPTSCGPPNEFVAKRSQAGSALSIELAAIPNRIGFPVLAGVVTDAHSGICTLGLADVPRDVVIG